MRRTRIEHILSALPPLATEERTFGIGTSVPKAVIFAERNVMEYWPDDHSGLMLAARITLAHFSVSSAISFSKSAGESASAAPRRAASRALILGSARPALISLLSLSTISGGVAFGAPTPYQKL